MSDSKEPESNDWSKIEAALRLALHEIERGGVVFVVCDAGVSRSVTFSGMVIAAVEHRRMDYRLADEIRSAIADPLHELWKTASKYMENFV